MFFLGNFLSNFEKKKLLSVFKNGRFQFFPLNRHWFPDSPPRCTQKQIEFFPLNFKILFIFYVLFIKWLMIWMTQWGVLIFMWKLYYDVLIISSCWYVNSGSIIRPWISTRNLFVFTNNKIAIVDIFRIFKESNSDIWLFCFQIIYFYFSFFFFENTAEFGWPKKDLPGPSCEGSRAIFGPEGLCQDWFLYRALLSPCWNTFCHQRTMSQFYVGEN